MNDNKILCAASDCMLDDRVITEQDQRDGLVMVNMGRLFHPECVSDGRSVASIALMKEK